MAWGGGEAPIRKTMRELADELDPERLARIRKRSFADYVEKSAPCGSGHSRVATTDRDTIAVERLHPKVST